ncbi:MAG TPA: alpha/beta fold hydrolase [Thermoanaerobaculia bacterium]|jgi:pimeloyl-ACP methyl ester carboxylesterase
MLYIHSISLLFALGAVFLLSLPAQAASPAEPATGFVEIPGGKLWYEARGEGTPMVLLHDGLLPSATWDGQVDAFSRSFRVIRYDRRGYGRSEPPKGPYSDIDDLHAVFEALKIARAVVVGCSSGGRLAVDYALAHPDRVEALVLVGPVVSGLPYSEHFLRRTIANYRPLYQERNVEELIDNWARDPYLIDAANTAAKERLRKLLATNRGPLERNNPESRPPDRPAIGRLNELRVPTLIVVGASDIPDVHAHAGVLEAGIHGARRAIVPGTGHLVHMEKPEVFNREVLDFLRPADAAREYLRTLAPLDLEKARRLFDYDAKAPLDVQEAGTERRGEVRIVDLSFASPMGGRVPAYLILPPGEGRRPAVLFQHPGQGDRSTFVDEAVELAGKGIVSLTISAPFLRPENQGQRGGNPWDPEVSRKEQLQTILDIRRGFDLLVSRPEVDPKRLVYVGHSLGATVAGPLAAFDRRPIAYVLMAGLPSLTHSYGYGRNEPAIAYQELLTRDQQKAYADALGPLDSMWYIGQAAPAKLLFQFARRDEYITPWDAATYIEAAPDPKEVKWYDTDHYFNEQARRDRVEWVVKVLR